MDEFYPFKKVKLDISKSKDESERKSSCFYTFK
jgi:hypothetical protein